MVTRKIAGGILFIGKAGDLMNAMPIILKRLRAFLERASKKERAA